MPWRISPKEKRSYKLLLCLLSATCSVVIWRVLLLRMLYQLSSAQRLSCPVYPLDYWVLLVHKLLSTGALSSSAPTQLRENCSGMCQLENRLCGANIRSWNFNIKIEPICTVGNESVEVLVTENWQLKNMYISDLHDEDLEIAIKVKKISDFLHYYLPN